MTHPASASAFHTPAGRSVALALLLMAATGTASASAATLECPATVRLDAPKASASGVPAGTEIVLDASPLRLTGYNFFDGPPAQGAALVPTSDKPAKGAKGGKGESTATWVFEGDYPQGKFASCDYAGGTVRLVQRMDDAAKRCMAMSRTAGNPSVLQVRFRCE
ncbi:STY0301 family protein [Paracidovorax avenae]|uniref:STY0301 family protein n=1 Tax=Paracidovorax avenae TaxID=80867 RepID=UPI003369F466